MQLIEHFIPFDRLLYKGLALSLPVLALALSFSTDTVLQIQLAIGIVALGAFIGFDAQGHSHLGQNQHSGKITAGIFAFLGLFYGGSLLL